jgi:hypothetical protein
MRVVAGREGFALGVGHCRVTLDKDIYVEVLVESDLIQDLHKLGELDSKCF